MNEKDTIKIDLERKAKCILKLIHTINEYFEAFHEPVPIKVLSAKYARLFQRLGGFSEVIEELSAFGQISVLMHKSGRKDVYPAGVAVENTEASKVLHGLGGK